MTDRWDRLPKELRAGTQLDWRAGNVEEVIALSPLRRTPVPMGHIDHRQRTYQCGGEFANFYFHKLGVLSIDGDVWEQVKSRVEWIEIIDHELNHCWRIRTLVAEREGYYYEQGIGPRWGVPQKFWSRSGGPVEQTRPEPPPPLQPRFKF